MTSLQQCIAVLRSLVAQLHELDRLRERVRKAELSVRRSRRTNRKKTPLAEMRPLSSVTRSGAAAEPRSAPSRHLD
jgi:hypothetical protein